MEDTNLLLGQLLLNSIGIGFFLYGKRQSRIVPLLSGLTLLTVPYMLPTWTSLLLLGGACAVAPYFLRS